ncbi:MAG TPA: alkaline phosphatase family protein [Kineosporiaceae bacterium]|nr:alkaline phosphatase family protein [Kineosporiaceae bacterium]
MRRRSTLAAVAVLATASAVVLTANAVPASAAGPSVTGRTAKSDPGDDHGRILGRFSHLVVIYQENHSFDNLYGNWGRVGGQQVDGTARADAAHTVQVDQNGKPYGCLLQKDVNLTSSPPAASCTDSAHGITSAFTNAPFSIDTYLPAAARTCPAPGVSAPNGVLAGSAGALPGGCTRDLVHRFYQEQYQLDGGRQDRYTTGSDAAGLTQGVYDTRQLPVWKYLHSKGSPNYVVADRFFQAAFGGSFLNHQYLIAAQAPVDTAASLPAGDPNSHAANHSVVDANGFPNGSYPLYRATSAVNDAQLTQACGPAANPAVACGDYAVNTVQPASQPRGGGLVLPLVQNETTIGDELSAKGISWAWYSGGWNAVNSGGLSAAPLFQFHHQPFNYFANYAPGQPGRAHLQDETDFLKAVEQGTLPTVSFVKPYGADNEHPGYASETDGSAHLVDLLKAIDSGPDAEDTLVVATYDEFGGQWDHVSPPGPKSPTTGAYDAFGPGTRIPALMVSRAFDRSGVDHTVYDTTSILATIEHSLGLKPLSTRDARVADLRAVLRVADH